MKSRRAPLNRRKVNKNFSILFVPDQQHSCYCVISGQSCLRRVTRRMLGILDNMAAIPGEGDHTMPRQHSNITISARPALLIRLLLAIILPASLLVCTYATADSATTESGAARAVAPTTHGNSGEEGNREAKQQPGSAPDITTQPTKQQQLPFLLFPYLLWPHPPL